MARFLMIPHAPATPLRTRAGELSRALASMGHQVDILHRSLQPQGLRPSQKVRWHVEQVTQGFAARAADPGVPLLRSLQVPTLHRWETARLTRWFENAISGSLFRRRYDFVVSSAYGGIGNFRSRRGPKPILIYDLVDDHGAGWRHAGLPRVADQADAFEREQIRLADCFIASSLVLGDLGKKKFGREPSIIPNGATVGEIRQKAVKRTANLTVGYVGGLERFVRIDLVIRALEKLRRAGLAVQLVVVGEGPAIRGLSVPSWVSFLGFRRPEEIPALLADFSVGIVPFELSPFTDAALPLKALEYGAAGIPTVSTPLEELKRRNLPWITLAELHEDEWARAIHRALETSWNSEWNAAVDRFEWARSAESLLRLLDVSAPPR